MIKTINERCLFVIDDYDYEPYQLLIFKSFQEAAAAEEFYKKNYEHSEEIEDYNLDEKVELITSRFDCEAVIIALSGDLTVEPDHKIYI